MKKVKSLYISRFSENKKLEFMTWDNMCLKKLKEMGKSTRKQWAKAMGYESSCCMKNIIKNNLDKLIITPSITRKNKYFYEVKENFEID